nr:hypothetical protein [uncultured archaeon]AQS28848.1 hypothetical protein [uncultured archaeon]AQS29035.1 hypothetical protein [uncultured archaeon]
MDAKRGSEENRSTEAETLEEDFDVDDLTAGLTATDESK